MQDTTVNSLHYLWAAYILVAVAQIAYVAWLAKGWSSSKETRR
jgi:hypothetical protein